MEKPSSLSHLRRTLMFFKDLGSELLEMGFDELTVTGKARNAESPAMLLLMVAENADITSSKFWLSMKD
nr:hypothetical protein Iba_scaffold13492CG0090 [Ipomoea batatas]